MILDAGIATKANLEWLSEWELYINSPSRAQKEGAMKTKFMQRMEEDLAKARTGLKRLCLISNIESSHRNGTKCNIAILIMAIATYLLHQTDWHMRAQQVFHQDA